MLTPDDISIDSLLKLVRSLPSLPEPIVYLVPLGYLDSIPRIAAVEIPTKFPSDSPGIPVIESRFVDRPIPVPRSVLYGPNVIKLP